jgi:hypothetical protein
MADCGGLGRMLAAKLRPSLTDPFALFDFLPPQRRLSGSNGHPRTHSLRQLVGLDSRSDSSDAWRWMSHG